MDDSLFKAVYINDLDTVKKLIDERNINVNEKDRLGRSYLQIACYFGFYAVCKALLERGAEIDEDCFRRAENGWDGFRQSDIIDLLLEWHNRQINTEE